MTRPRYWSNYMKCDIRDPYMGNTIPVTIELRWDGEGLRELIVTNGEGISIKAKPYDPEDVQPMNT